MFNIRQNDIIKNINVPVLTRQKDGRFEFKDCYFLEFIVTPKDTIMKKIDMICKPFDFNTGVKNAVVSDNDIKRLFLLANSDIIKNNFQEQDDFLALALCNDNKQKTIIQYFEVNHKFRHSYDPNQKYRRVGTSAVNALKQIYYDRELYGKSAIHALNFWLKNGFTRLNEYEQYIYWRQK